MLEQLFVDTGYVIALINETDRNHGQALALADKYDGCPVVTTDAVLLEIGNALSRIARSQAVEIIDYFQQAAEVTLVHLNPILFSTAVRMCEQYADKTWGLVDCVSFLVMREMKITAVLGFDRHFIQAGFHLLGDT